MLDSGPYSIFDRPYVLKYMPIMFQFEKDVLSTLPVWINLPSLPRDMWNGKILGKICSVVVDPICTDAFTCDKKKISYARVRVQVNMAKKLIKEVIIDMRSGEVIHQEVIYENLPRFCYHCKVLGHT